MLVFLVQLHTKILNFFTSVLQRLWKYYKLDLFIFSNIRIIHFEGTLVRLLSGNFRSLKLCIHDAFHLDVLIWSFQETAFNLYIYETDSNLCNIEDLIFLEKKHIV